jgi:hypothetical protein
MIAETAGAKNDLGSTTRTRTRTEIHIETREVFVIRSMSQPCIAWCEACGVEVRIVTPEQAAARAQTTQREIYRRIEDGSQHTVETSDGTTFLCCQTEQS